MDIDKTLVRKHFDRRASEYEQYARVQRMMLEHLDRQLPAALPDDARVLEIGCGTGRWTRRLRERYPNARMTAVDLAPRMIEQAKLLAGSAAEVEWVAADAEEWIRGEAAADRRYELIVSNAAFQWFQQPLETLSACAARLAPGGRLLVSTFGPDTFREFHEACRLADERSGIAPARRGQHFPSLQEWASACGGEWGEAFVTERHPDLRAFLDSVRGIGASRADRAAARPLTRAYLRILEETYESLHGSHGRGLPVTYHAVYGRISR